MLHHFTPAIQFIRSNDLPTIWKEVMRRDTHPMLQFLKYGFCGFAAFVTHQLVWLLLSTLVLPAIDSDLSRDTRALNSTINNCIAFFFSTTIAYIGNVLWVFTPGRHSRTAEIFYFYGVSFISLAGGLAAGPWLIKIFGISTVLAQLSLTVTSVLINYVCRKFFIFKH